MPDGQASMRQARSNGAARAVNIPSGRSFVAFASGALLSVAGATRTPAAPLPAAVDSAITTDLPRDAAHPAAMYQLAIPSHDAALFGVFYRAAGSDPHPTVLLLHALPGFEQNADVAQTLRRAGWNVLIFHYRGAWGSGGAFSFSNCIDDVHAALDYLRAPENVARLGIDPRRLALIGHGMGGFLAGIGTMRDEAVLGAALISAWNPGVLATNPSPKLEKAHLDEFRSDVGPLVGTTPESLLEEAKKNATAWDLVGHAALWNSRPVLVVESDDFFHADDVAIAAAVRKIPSAQLTEMHLPTDHAYSDHRIALAAALLGWLKQLEPPRLPRHSERVRGSGITDSR
ncbi:MAG: histidine triad protein [Gammaproteobacteria bacterium]|nr:histidine triad protein [Gammaproteobacteria bacterium]